MLPWSAGCLLTFNPFLRVPIAPSLKVHRVPRQGRVIFETTQGWLREKLRKKPREKGDWIPAYLISKDRAMVGELIGLRTGHGNYQTYHDRFRHDATVRCSCGQSRGRRHVLSCPLGGARLMRTIRNKTFHEAWELCLSRKVGHLVEWMESCNYPHQWKREDGAPPRAGEVSGSVRGTASPTRPEWGQDTA